MSMRILQKYEELKLIKGSNEAMADVMRRTGKSERTIQRWLQAGFPSAHDALNFALACGVGEGEALALARECTPHEAKRTA